MMTLRGYARSRDTATATGLLLVALALGATAGIVGVWSVAALAPLYVALCIVSPAAGAASLIACCVLDRFSVSVGGANLRPDELAALAFGGALAVRVLLRRGPSSWPGLAVVLAIAVYWGSGVLSTLTSADPARGLSLDLLMLDLVILFCTLAAYCGTPARLWWGIRLWLGVAAVEAVIGVLAFGLYLGSHAAVPGVQLAPDTRQPLVYGTLYEGNIFGSYMSAAFLIALALATEETVRRKAPVYLVLALTALGLLLSNTRSAWGATVIGAALLVILLHVGRGGRRMRAALRLVAGLIAVALVVGAVLAIAPASITGTFGARIQSLLNFGSGSGYGRLLLYQEALSEWQAHPLLGLGPGSFSYRLPGDMTPGPAWLPNLTLQALHDTGIVGALAMLWLFIAFYVTTLRALRRAAPGQVRAALAGLIAAVTAMLIAFQLTPGFSLGYSWALLALGIAAARAAACVPDAARAAGAAP